MPNQFRKHKYFFNFTIPDKNRYGSSFRRDVLLFTGNYNSDYWFIKHCFLVLLNLFYTLLSIVIIVIFYFPTSIFILFVPNFISHFKISIAFVAEATCCVSNNPARVDILINDFKRNWWGIFIGSTFVKMRPNYIRLVVFVNISAKA